MRVVHKIGNLDATLENNLDRLFRRIDTVRRRERFGWISESDGSRFRDEMKDLLAAYVRGKNLRWRIGSGSGSARLVVGVVRSLCSVYETTGICAGGSDDQRLSLRMVTAYVWPPNKQDIS